jgi:hypothetical protein
MTVKLVGTFFSNGTWSTNNVGDLYISSTGWHLSTSDSPHFPTNPFTNTEGWNYVVTMGGWSYQNYGWTWRGDPGVYSLNDFNSITMTDPTYYGGGGRAYQAWRGGYDVTNPNSEIEGLISSSLDSTGMSFTFNDSF